MPKTERDPLGPAFHWRLKSQLDRVQPRWSSPRYLTPHRVSAWRLAPAALALGVSGLLFLTAFAATGSANPAVWTERAVTVIHPAPPATPEVTPPADAPQVAPPAVRASAQPSERAEPAEQPPSPEPKETPEPGGDRSGSGSNTESPSAWDH